MNTERAEARREARDQKKAERRKALAAKPGKQTRRRQSLRGQVQLHDRLLGALLLELRKFTIEMKQVNDTHAILLSVLTKAAGGRELTEEDRAVIQEYIEAEGDTEAEPQPAGVGSELDTERLAETGEV